MPAGNHIAKEPATQRPAADTIARETPAPGFRHENIPSGVGTTETPLEMPTLKRTLMYLGRAVRFRCPHCGEGKVMRGWGTVHERCSHCNYRFARSGPEYFTGAMFCNFLIAEFLFATGFGTAVVVTWPDVPWDAMTWVAVVGAVAVPTLLYPFSKVTWLTVDTLVRPVMPEELQ